MNKENLKIVYVSIYSLVANDKNPRKWSEEQKEQLKESIKRFGNVDPIIVNTHEERKNIIVGGHFRVEACKELGYKNMPVVFVNLTPEKEAELNLRLNRNQGEFDLEMLAEFDSSMLLDIGFTSEDIDDIFPTDKNEEQFDLQKELDKLDITVEAKKGEIYDLDGSRLMIGDSTIEADMLKLIGDNKVDMVLTDPPYILDYLKGKGRGKDGPTVGFGSKKNRRYLETDVLPENFSDLWMANVAKVQKPDFSIIIFENPKNLRTIWNALEVHWKYRNTITWHVPNRMQGFSASNKFFNKTDIALVGSSGEVNLNLEPEEGLFQNEYENAIFATSGKPHFEPYEKGKKICPTDFISHTAADKKSSGQEIIFGTKPIELLIPYLKVLTKRNDLILEPFGGSGSTLIASVKMGRRCFIMEKSHVYAEVIMNRWEKETGKKRKKIN
ncbi:MAG: ParB N-terminal domain-containing protein [Candidatus Pacebacteria bacterium]|nr:ParB N-terminal domain-containing protein [Candidatus Paceibacterota bacterium]